MASTGRKRSRPASAASAAVAAPPADSIPAAALAALEDLRVLLGFQRKSTAASSSALGGAGAPSSSSFVSAAAQHVAAAADSSAPAAADADKALAPPIAAAVEASAGGAACVLAPSLVAPAAGDAAVSNKPASSSGAPPPPLAPPLSADGARALVERALLWLRPEPFSPLPEDALPLHEQSVEVVERAFPSLHTCLLANVVAFADVLALGPRSRFAGRGSLPPVYLACAMNFERDAAHALLSCEVAIAEHQEQCVEEARAEAEVRFALDPVDRCDWLAFFRRRFELVRAYEVWRGDDFVENVPAPPPKRRGFSCLPVYTLKRCALATFGDAVGAPGAGAGAGAGGAGRAEAAAGTVVVYRQGPPESEPFGMWLAFVLLHGHLLIVDMQNGIVSASLAEAIAALHWEEAPRDEVFFALLLKNASAD